MKKEKHTLTNPYNHHALSRYIDVYEVSAKDCAATHIMSGLSVAGFTSYNDAFNY